MATTAVATTEINIIPAFVAKNEVAVVAVVAAVVAAPVAPVAPTFAAVVVACSP